ncbi:transposase [Chloroflexota bacterium]
MNEIACKYCGSSAVSKYGRYGDTQLYWCKVCERKFKDGDTLFHMKVSPDYVARALDMYYTGDSINDICEHFRNADGYYPSKSVVFGWIDKFTDRAVEYFRQFQPKVGNEWQCDETVLRLDKKRKIWLWDIIDSKTKYLICTRVSDTRTTHDAQALMGKAKRITGISPKQITTDQLRAYWDGIELTFGSETDHVQGGPFKGKDTGESTSQIERFHSTIKERTKVMKSFRNVDSLIQFMDGFLVWYNYLKPHHSLYGKTPAEAAGIDYDVKNWQAVCRLPDIEDEIVSGVPSIASSRKTTRAIKWKPVNRAGRRDSIPTSIRGIRQ